MESYFGLMKYLNSQSWLTRSCYHIGTFQELKGWSSHLWQSHSFRFYYERVHGRRKLIDKFAETDNYI